MWRDFCAPADAVVFLIDASNKSRFAESKAELDCLLADEQVYTCIHVFIESMNK